MADNEPAGGFPDEELARRVQTGDEQAARRLFHRLLNPLYQFLRKRGASDQDAEEVVAEALEIAFARIGQYDGRGKFFSWVCAIAWHALLRRRRGFKPEFLPLEECLEIPAERHLEPQERLRRKQELNLLQNCLDRLTPQQRQAVMLVELEGMTLKEAAVIMNRSPGAVAMLVDRAKRRMKSLIGRMTRGEYGQD